MFQGFKTPLMIFMALIQPGDQDGGVHQDHGRVRRNSALPETRPSQEAARSRICLWNSFRIPGFFLASITLPLTAHCNTVPEAIPSSRRVELGMVVVPCILTAVY